MRTEYILVIENDQREPFNFGVPQPLATELRLAVGSLRVGCYANTEVPNSWIELEHNQTESLLTITEGLPVLEPNGRQIRPGTYNEIHISGVSQEVVLRNDVMGTLPCYFVVVGSALVITNSIHLLRSSLKLFYNYSAIAQRFLLAGWTVDERTLYEGVHLMAPGMAYRFDGVDQWRCARERLARSWTGVLSETPAHMIQETCHRWDQAIARTADQITDQLGIMLSGGLDSRMVAAGFAQRNIPMVGLTHGNISSGEAAIARQVCDALGIRWLTNPLDDTFEYDTLNIVGMQAYLDNLFNPIWDSSGNLLAQQGMNEFSTGAGLEGLLGGRTDYKRTRRMIKNLTTPVLALLPARRVTEKDIVTITSDYEYEAQKRCRGYARLLTKPYRELVESYVSEIGEPIREHLARMAAAGDPAPQQIRERFVYEQREKQVMVLQELQLTRYGKVFFPTYDLDLVEYVSNIKPAFKYDHHLYYLVIKRLYAKMAGIDVTNLGTHLNRPRIAIEMERFWRITRNRRLSTWVNFEDWISRKGRLEKHEHAFLANDHFFDTDRIKLYFDDIRNGNRRLYDGNETMSFLSLALATRPTTSR